MALQKHLTARTDRPQLIKASARQKGEGTLKANIKEGEAFLKNDAGKVYRLAWSKKGKPARHLPAGTYTLTGYRVVDGEWFLSTAGGRSKVKVRKGKTTRLKLGSVVHIKLRAQRKRNGTVSLGMNVENDRGMGLSLYRNGKRIPIPYQFLSKTGDKLTAGKMNYG